jgi:hypothetical protein
MNCIEVITTPVELYLKSYITRHKNLFLIFDLLYIIQLEKEELDFKKSYFDTIYSIR